MNLKMSNLPIDSNRNFSAFGRKKIYSCMCIKYSNDFLTAVSAVDLWRSFGLLTQHKYGWKGNSMQHKYGWKGNSSCNVYSPSLCSLCFSGCLFACCCLFQIYICQFSFNINYVIGNIDIFLHRDLDFVQYLHTAGATIQYQPPVDSFVRDLLRYRSGFCISTTAVRSRFSAWQETRNKLHALFFAQALAFVGRTPISDTKHCKS